MNLHMLQVSNTGRPSMAFQMGLGGATPQASFTPPAVTPILANGVYTIASNGRAGCSNLLSAVNCNVDNTVQMDTTGMLQGHGHIYSWGSVACVSPKTHNTETSFWRTLSSLLFSLLPNWLLLYRPSASTWDTLLGKFNPLCSEACLLDQEWTLSCKPLYDVCHIPLTVSQEFKMSKSAYLDVFVPHHASGLVCRVLEADLSSSCTTT